MKSILLIMIGFSGFLFADFVKNGDIVTDTATGLQWQDDADAASMRKKWIEAINYCENLTLGGHNDWRLPNINELKSIVDRSKSFPAIVDGFTNVSAGYYRSSTTAVANSDVAWVVDFSDGSANGYVYHESKFFFYYVRCVRAGQ